MTCHSCVATITQELKDKEGIVDIEVSLKDERGLLITTLKLVSATVSFDPSRWSPEMIATAIEDLGYETAVVEGKPRIHEVLVSIQGMKCKSCVKKIESTLGEKDGIKSVSVNLAAAQGILF